MNSVTHLFAPKLFLILFLLVLMIVLNLSYPAHNQFSLLATSFLQGRSDLTPELNNEITGDFFMHDSAMYSGKYFWPLGPMPSVLLIPIVFIIPTAFQAPTAQGILNVLIVSGIIYLLWQLVTPLFQNTQHRIALVIAFIAGSPLLYVALIPKSWFIAQSLTTFLTLLALSEYFTKRRFWFIGLIYGLILATRVTATIGILAFFLMMAFEHRNSVRLILKHSIAMSIPMLIVGMMLGVYNYTRFDSPVEQGYRYQMVANQLATRMEQGIVSLRHVPANLYYLFAAPPLLTNNNRIYPISADPWGMSILITSPYLIWLILHPPRERNARIMLMVSGIIMLPIVFYYGIGFYQFGYRYVLDCFPFLFMCFVLSYHQHHAGLTQSMERVMFISAFLNLYFVLTLL